MLKVLSEYIPEVYEIDFLNKILKDDLLGREPLRKRGKETTEDMIHFVWKKLASYAGGFHIFGIDQKTQDLNFSGWVSGIGACNPREIIRGLYEVLSGKTNHCKGYPKSCMEFHKICKNPVIRQDDPWNEVVMNQTLTRDAPQLDYDLENDKHRKAAIARQHLSQICNSLVKNVDPQTTVRLGLFKKNYHDPNFKEGDPSIEEIEMREQKKREIDKMLSKNM